MLLVASHSSMSWGEADPATWSLETVVPIDSDEFDDASLHRIRTDMLRALECAPEPMCGPLLCWFDQPTFEADRIFVSTEEYYADLLMQSRWDWNQEHLIACLRDLVVRETVSLHQGRAIPLVTHVKSVPTVLQWTIHAVTPTGVVAQHTKFVRFFNFTLGAYQTQFPHCNAWFMDDLGPLVLERWRSANAQAAAEELTTVWPPELIPWVVQYLTTASVEENKRLVHVSKRCRKD